MCVCCVFVCVVCVFYVSMIVWWCVCFIEHDRVCVCVCVCVCVIHLVRFPQKSVPSESYEAAFVSDVRL